MCDPISSRAKFADIETKAGHHPEGHSHSLKTRNSLHDSPWPLRKSVFGTENVPRRGREKSCCKNASLRRRLPRSLNFLFLSAFFVPLFLSFSSRWNFAKTSASVFSLSLSLCDFAGSRLSRGRTAIGGEGAEEENCNLGIWAWERIRMEFEVCAHTGERFPSLYSSGPDHNHQCKKRNFISFTSLLRLTMLCPDRGQIYLCWALKVAKFIQCSHHFWLIQYFGRKGTLEAIRAINCGMLPSDPLFSWSKLRAKPGLLRRSASLLWGEKRPQARQTEGPLQI